MMAQNSVDARECSGEYPMASLSCLSDLAKPDVRIYITEFQKCSEGKITEKSKMVTGFYSPKPNSYGEIETYNQDQTEISYYPNQMKVDPELRVDHLSIEMPRLVSFGNEHKVSITISQKKKAFAHYDQDFYYPATFQVTTGDKTSKQLKMKCTISH